MEKHTKGPWKIDPSDEFPLAVIVDHDYEYDDGTGICQIQGEFDNKSDATPEQIANARLIAAAPELLAELRALVQWCEDNFIGEDSGPELDGAYNAIRKAEE